MKRNLALCTLALCTVLSATASQPLRRQVTRLDADGKEIVVERRGDDRFAWWQDADDQCYAMDEQRHTLRPIDGGYVEMRRQMNASTPDGLGEYGRSGQGVVRSLGNPLIPVIMVAFSDLDFLPEDDKVKVGRFLNEEGYRDEQYAVGSVADYFEHNSRGLFRPRFEVVAKVTLSGDYKSYGAHSGSANDAQRKAAVNEAVALAEAQGVDFSKFATDGRAPLISIMHAGPGEQEDYGSDYGDFFWAHFSQSVVNAGTTTFDGYLLTNETLRDFDKEGNLTLERMTGIGTFCHEFSHALGLPDMYDVSGSNSHTPGYWDVMDYQFMYDGYRPMEYSAYERSLMGWLSVAELDADAAGSVFTLGPLTAERAEGEADAYRIVNPADPNEYFLLENRKKNNFYQSTFLGEGMLVWHIFYDSAIWASNRVNTNPSQQRVKVVPADGMWQPNTDLNKRDEANQRYSFTGDVFPGYANVTSFGCELDDYYNGHFDQPVGNISLDESGNIHFAFSPITSLQGITWNASTTTAPYDLQGRQHHNTPLKGGIYVSGSRKQMWR